jgi:TM2 domain-containing membrane protein YozV
MSEETNQSNAPEESSAPQTPPTASPPSIQPAASSYPKEQTDKKLVSGILAILLGALGIHKFYLGYQKEGIIMLAVSIGGSVALCGIPFAAFAVSVIGLVEGILYLTKTDDEFVATYVVGRKPWF